MQGDIENDCGEIIATTYLEVNFEGNVREVIIEL